MKRRLFSVLLFVGALGGLAGSVAPWVPHRAAGLRIGAFDLFEVVKYLPGVRTGEFALFREGFLLPLLISAVLIAWVPVAWKDAPRLIRWAMPVVALVIAAMALPPYPQIKTAYRDPEYRGQLLLSAGTLCLIVVSPLARRISARVKTVLPGLLALVGLILPLIPFFNVHGLFVELYNSPVGIGWGLVLYVVGMILVLVGVVFGVLFPDYECQE